MNSRRRIFKLVLLLSLTSLSVPAYAWSPKTQLAIAGYASSFAPPDLERQIEKHIKQFRRGVVAPFQNGDAARHNKDSDSSGLLDQVIFVQAEAVINAIQTHQPFADIVYKIGVLSHYLADSNNPLSTSNSDSQESRYYADFLKYLESAYPRFSVVFYPTSREPRRSTDLPGMVATTLQRGRTLYPMIGREYRRIGGTNGSERFDDRSTAFGVGSVAFSRAVSDIATVLRYVWIRSGGVDNRGIPTLDEQHLVLLSAKSSAR
jgi:hypothetical protein